MRWSNFLPNKNKPNLSLFEEIKHIAVAMMVVGPLTAFGISGFDFTTKANAEPIGWQPVFQRKTNIGEISISKRPFAPRSPAGTAPFSRIEAWHLGVDRPNLFSIGDMTLPMAQAPGSIAAADMDNDGDQDLVLSDIHGGIKIFLNDGTGKFKKHHLGIPAINSLPIMLAVPVDINNDGCPDLIITTFLEGEYISLNYDCKLKFSKAVRLKNQPDARFVNSLALGDLDKNGWLDIVFGNSSSFPTFFEKGKFDQNRIIFRHSGKFEDTTIWDTSGKHGNTLTTLLSDFNQDGNLDLIEGNDFTEPDIFYIGDGKGKLTQITTADGIIPYTTLTTMSAKSADLDNDLRLELYMAQIAGRANGLTGRVELLEMAKYCENMQRPKDQKACQENMEIKKWYRAGFFDFSKSLVSKCTKFPTPKRHDCYSLLLRNLALIKRQERFCDRIPDDNLRYRKVCKFIVHAKRIPGKGGRGTPTDGKIVLHVDEKDIANEIPQLFGANVLLVDRGDGIYEDRAKAANLQISGWVWDVKIFDFDNDGLQDIHILNGDWHLTKAAPSNVFMHNNGSMKFANKTKEYGLVDYLMVTASAGADFDNDGDIDEIAQTVNGPLVAYWNNSQSGNSIAFEYRDHVGNRFGIGNKISIYYGENGERAQLREMKMSGGYMSYDAPVAHFGLGSHKTVQKIKIEWSTGGASLIEGPFNANATYQITRR